MLSSLNQYSGLSTSQLLSLFSTNSASSSADSQQQSQVQASGAYDTSVGVNDPASSIKAIIANARMNSSGLSPGGWTITEAAQAAYSSQMGGDGMISATIAVSSPSAAQQINQAVDLINQAQIVARTGIYSNGITVTTANAVNLNFGSNGISATTVTGAQFPNGLPSLTSIQNALDSVKSRDESIGFNGVEATSSGNKETTTDNWWNSTYNGNVTLIQLPTGNIGADGFNYVAFSDGDTNWALVVTHDNVNASVSVAKQISQ